MSDRSASTARGDDTALHGHRETRDPIPKQALVLALLIAIPLLVGFLGSQVTAGEVDGWYAEAEKAPWNPPNWVFGPVWTALYIIMGVASWLLWRRRGRRGASTALGLYVAQLALNSIWSPLFFGGYPLWGSPALWGAFALILALLAALTLTIRSFWKVHRPGAVLLLPYLGWVLYASTLNLYIAVMN